MGGLVGELHVGNVSGEAKIILGILLQGSRCYPHRRFHPRRFPGEKLQPDKCEFLRKEVVYLGHVITEDGIRPDPSKLEAV